VLDIKSNVNESAIADASFEPYDDCSECSCPVCVRSSCTTDSGICLGLGRMGSRDEPDVIKTAIANALSDTAEYAAPSAPWMLIAPYIPLLCAANISNY